MKRISSQPESPCPLERASSYGRTFRKEKRPLHPSATTAELREAFCQPLPEDGTGPREVIDRLISAAEPGLVGNTAPGFFAWVMGGSSEIGVAADWLTSIWGQNAAIYQTSPAAAIAEEGAAAWLLDVLDLPRDSSVGFVTGATMAGFVGLAAARTTVLARAGHDFEQLGLQGAPHIRIFLSDDAHVANLTALRHLGFGEANFARIPSNDEGLMDIERLGAELAVHSGPKIIIAQAGHINSGGFEDMAAISVLAKQHDAWMHVDGAFGLWARVLPEKDHLTRAIELADSWSVDGHKWLQIPYDSGFAIVRDASAHRKAMDMSAGYLNQSPEDGRNPTEFSPGLSRRARGFAVWAVLLALGRKGLRDLIRQHCDAASALAQTAGQIDGLEVTNTVHLNQVVLRPSGHFAETDRMCLQLADQLNQSGDVFVRPACWKGKTVLRVSIIEELTGVREIERFAEKLRAAWQAVSLQEIVSSSAE